MKELGRDIVCIKQLIILNANKWESQCQRKCDKDVLDFNNATIF